MIFSSLGTDAMRGQFLLNIMIVICALAAIASPILHLAFAFGWLKY